MNLAKTPFLNILCSMLFFCVLPSFATEVPIYDFPISAYSQNSADYISKDSKNYTQSLLSKAYQALQLEQFYQHYYASDAQGLSPWSAQMVNASLPLIFTTETDLLEDFNNQSKTKENKHYAENFKEQTLNWWNQIRRNMNLSQMAALSFHEESRAIAVAHTFARALPDDAPDFYHFSLAGEGFPFDNLQQSIVWAGTPLYVFNESKDQAWSLVLTPDGFFAWIKTHDLAYVSPEFINKWQNAARKGLVAITKTKAHIVDFNQEFQLSGYIGSVFPMVHRSEQKTTILIPVRSMHHQAMIKKAIISNDASTKMPLPASPKNLLKIIDQLKNRPYGWGGAFFFNDCSLETKSIFTPFGIWLPRNSMQQSKLNGTLDLSDYSLDDRLKLLQEKGHPLLTLIYIGRHVMLYIGQKSSDNLHDTPIIYHNIWGLSPAQRNQRYVIGQSLFFPLLKQYPENPELKSLADGLKFKLIYLDALDERTDSPQIFSSKFLKPSAN